MMRLCFRISLLFLALASVTLGGCRMFDDGEECDVYGASDQMPNVSITSRAA